MKLTELSLHYRDNAAVLRERMTLLRQEQRETEDPERRRRLEQRIRELTPLLREARELQSLTAHYYDRGYPRNEKYTL